MPFPTSLALVLALVGCGTEWAPIDEDGDGKTLAGGDCDDWDSAVHGGAEEIWYDGIDQDCDGLSDFDKDGDGFDAAGLDPSLPGYDPNTATDCWDDPDTTPAGFDAVVGADQPSASQVYPGATDSWYDGVDQNCDDGDDFDQDGDGHASTDRTPSGATALPADDCYDSVDDDYPWSETACDYSGAAEFEPRDIHGGAEDDWYDGTDADCAGNDDFDSDDDGFGRCEECADDDPDRFPLDVEEDVWYDGVDYNCDGNDGDQDGDGYYIADYEELSGTAVPEGWTTGIGDCWDDPTGIPEAYTAVDGFPQPGPDEVHPDAADDTWYDGVDQDCAGNSDFDQDHDGYDSEWWPDRDGAVGEDCDDEDGDVHPGADEIWYDGADQACDGGDDYDQDGDGYRSDAWGGDDCDDNASGYYVNPGMNEDCATADLDDDCDGAYDLQGADDCIDFYLDDDRDGHATTDTVCMCEAYGDYDVTDLDLVDDCDDSRDDVNPDMAEGINDALDSDCDGLESCWIDRDGDDYGSTDSQESSTDLACDDDAEAANADDCDDTDNTVHPSATELVANATDDDCDGTELCYVDDDGDDFGDDSGATVVSADTGCTGAGEADNAEDCDDASGTTWPGADEVVADGVDQSCDGTELCYGDDDGDGYGSSSRVTSLDLACSTADGEADDADDCNDDDADVSPAAAESIANGVDDDCDGAELCYADLDQDNQGDADGSTVISADLSCLAASYESANAFDCDDGDDSVYLGAPEVVADAVDQDCDGGDVCYVDLDGDGFGDESGDTVESTDTRCTAAAGESSVATDCDDGDDEVHPSAAEVVVNGKDDDCDGYELCYVDADGDHYGSSSTAETSTNTSCTDSGEANVSTDCNDASSSVNPGVTDTPANGVDDNCNGYEACYVDSDGDGYGSTTSTEASTDLSCTTGTEADDDDDCNDSLSAVNPGATETPANSRDDDCDGKEACYVDSDGDGQGNASGSTTETNTDLSCNSGTEADDKNDCDDGDDTVYTGALEVPANSQDDDCDGYEACYVDSDGDGWGGDSTTETNTDLSCNSGSEADDTDDCNDAASSIHPSAAETTGDDVDQDCDDHDQCYYDGDRDGYGISSLVDSVSSTCVTASYEAKVASDCDDANSGVSPGDAEITASGVDENCDGYEVCYVDNDDDGNGTTTTTSSTDESCGSDGLSTTSTDCDDADEYVYAGATELCDGQQNNCSTSWTAASENSTVSFQVTATGEWSNLTSTFAAGTSATPATVSATTSGTYHICSGTWYAGISASSFNVDISGRASSGTQPTLSRNSKSGSLISVNGGDVDISGLTLGVGVGTNVSSAGEYYGGGLWLQGDSVVTVSSCDFTNGTATSDFGGAIAVAGTVDLSLDDVSITGAVAEDRTTNGVGGYGGAIAVLDSATVSIANSLIDETDADYGTIWIEDAGEVSCDSSTLSDALVTMYGAVGYFSSATLGSFVGTSCTLSNNKAYGGTASPNDGDFFGTGFAAEYFATGSDFSCTATGCTEP